MTSLPSDWVYDLIDSWRLQVSYIVNYPFDLFSLPIQQPQQRPPIQQPPCTPDSATAAPNFLLLHLAYANMLSPSLRGRNLGHSVRGKQWSFPLSVHVVIPWAEFKLVNLIATEAFEDGLA